MRTLAILPIKSFAQAKQRLRSELSDADRRALVDAMFSDVLVALRRVPELERIIVVSGDRVAQRIAQGYGATVVEDDERGHNSAASRRHPHRARGRRSSARCSSPGTARCSTRTSSRGCSRTRPGSARR